MTLTPEEKSKQARKAALVAVKNRRRLAKRRDDRLWLAYKWLEGEQLTTEQAREAVAFLSPDPKKSNAKDPVPQDKKKPIERVPNPIGVNKPLDGTSTYLFLARAMGMTKQAIWAIIQKKMRAQLIDKA